MATIIKYNGQVIETLGTGKTGEISFADEKMYGDIVVEATEDTEIRYKGAVLAKGQTIIVHCADKIMRGEMLIAAAGRLKLNAPVIYIESAKPDYDGTPAILGKAILGKTILGKTFVLPQLDTPVIRLVKSDAKQLDAPVIYLDTGTEVQKLTAPTIYLQTDAEVIKLDTPTIYLETDGDIPDEPIVIKLAAPTIYIESDTPDEPDVPELEKLGTPEIYIYTEDEPDEPIIVKLDAPVIYIEADPDIPDEPETPKLDAPTIYLEESGVKWSKYNTVDTEHYRYVRDGYFVGKESSSNYDFWWTTPNYPTQYAFSDTEGYYVPSGTPMVNSENIVGAYIVYWREVYQITGIEPAPEADWASGLYRISSICVDSATAELDSITYSKGDTLLGTVEADEGEMPADGEVLDYGNGWYIIRTTDGIYYYEREV